MENGPAIVDDLLANAAKIEMLDPRERGPLFRRAADHLQALCAASGDRLPDSAALNIKGLRRTAELAAHLTPDQAAGSMRSTAHMITATSMLAARKS